MLCDGYAQTEVSKALGMTEEKVGFHVRWLRFCMIEQALAQAERLDADLREHLEQISAKDAKQLSFTAAGEVIRRERRRDYKS